MPAHANAHSSPKRPTAEPGSVVGQPVMQRIIDQRFTVSYSFPVIFTRTVFDAGNTVLLDVMARSGHAQNRVLVVVDSEVLRLNPGLSASIERYGETHKRVMRLVAPPFLMKGGENCKNDRSEVGRIHALVERHKLCRHSFIIAIGGGAVLDAVGYAAATAHRGVRLIRLPTTVLAQNDAGVGVKNGINAFGRKNFIGTFAPPFAVINDSVFLESLPARDLRAGIAEAVKVALIQDREFFDFLYRERTGLSRFIPAVMENMIFRCAELHVRHISRSGDPFESGSSRPLDFGHWIAHKLEELTGGDIRHGEAVAIGIAVDSLYSHGVGLLGDPDLHRILTLLETLGFELNHPALPRLDPEAALAEFREHLGGALSIPLLEGIGRKVDAHRIDIPLMKQCIAMLAEPVPSKGLSRG
ncbi:3-dehydroquinate synthase [Methylocaldum marinum]|uniref:3-dehydroquinate synthase n=1 Tax=Methylocaldum marinum TaxID=1432792 RepID=A0A250KV98_9GAMM|nr:3-dehydroquinate synthase [Methylocaldum marinum]BBA35456.1 3-dehydroquinate synthase [Methylocaldum marinum]